MKKLNYYGNKYERVVRVKKRNHNSLIYLPYFFFGVIFLIIVCQLVKDLPRFENIKTVEAHEYISPLATNAAQLSKTSTVSGEISAVDVPLTPTAIPTPTELEQVVAYITRKFEGEGKDVVVRAINCFYSESGLRVKAVGQNSDEPRSKDHGVAQLNDYWHKLTEAQKTEYKANIDKAYEIYKGRGDNFSAWYGKRCN